MKAQYRVLIRSAVFILIDDVAREDTSLCTITNDAEAVTKALIQDFGREGAFVYRDTDGQWTRLEHDGEKFTGFDIAPPKVQEAINELLNLKMPSHVKEALLNHAAGSVG